MTKVVVIGAGQAAASLVARLRSKGFDGDISVFGDEPQPPYQRPPLSKAYLLGDMALERLFLRPETFYEQNAVEMRTGAAVDSVDRAAKTISVSGENINYDHLVFCTGSAPRRLPSAIGGDLKGVFVVRSLADVDDMAPHCKDGARVLIVGGGYIGLEAAAVASKLGLKVTLVEAADRILQRVAAPETSSFFRDLHTAHGVDLREGCGLEKLTGDGQVSGAELTDGTCLDVDFVIVGVGITPGDALAETAGIKTENGIKVNAQGQTSDHSIWAAGDCASFPNNGVQMRLESVGNAVDMGELVADNIMGADRNYTAKPWFWSDQYDVKLQIAGLNTGYDRVVVRDSGDGVRSHWYYAGTTLLAVDAMNDPRGYMVGKRLIEAGKSPAAELVADSKTDLKALLKA
ncbi:NAD(P)/FAD-dependent oxidoreductase [Pelagimonas varians]|uniref:Ferredoxin--NAD(P)(+) reductase fdr n=1 Tax=Pelagimonas varians TaxID=696760 RepID=A0A238KLS1_9RHOB|nr:FAD/NAD(P)-binding oxidoreductase [Pelagimonas varians]PYG29105.1 3-phenylpropionate/trans-cinnamate dioxygenase ferredoxin reductase subunit [Pelagimonas varians]SMX43755.1 Ferredoxin--NAD(P)(+) reductase fdr [Pelagimonas varians]